MNWIQNILVGFLFFGALFLVGYFTIVSESGPFAQPGKRMVFYFDHADGIKEGSRVTVLGVPSGSVTGVDLVTVNGRGDVVEPDSPNRVRQIVAVTIELKKQVVFYENYRIAIKNESLLSGKVVSVDPGSSSTQEGTNPQQITVFSVDSAVLSSTGQSALEYRLTSSSDQYVDLKGESSGDPIAGFSELIAENRADLRRTVQNVAEITDKINRGDGTVGKLINDAELHNNATTLVTEAQVVVREVRESLEDTREQAPVTSFVRAALTAF
ncbi:MAG TPA: MCE family protein [Leptospiraceae bacterium]|nr:ABC transporter substrate-binding protein [Spirochaetaceae bacterium]HBS06652.1 MCE family protein [Leptospiraceae bacterium]